ncbi:unnamed protein product [Gongylonema pulchrum]|uniref:TonB-dependent receptor n=1 Tax=Gongylonema pulchrum TaxID=637853 RepID=A0A183CXG8_9BILA|nr:unnamed protein product [Gongylonema pulchrum]
MSQHAAAGLRKTEHDRSLRRDFEDLSNGRLDRTDQQLSGRYRADGSFDVPVEANQARAPLNMTFDPSIGACRPQNPIENHVTVR